MHKELREKYNINDRHSSFPIYDHINNNREEDKKTKCCFTASICAITLLNTLYVGIALYFYKNYVHDTFLNDPNDIDNTYGNLKHLVDFSCEHIPNINC